MIPFRAKSDRNDTAWSSLLRLWGPVAVYTLLIFLLSSVSDLPSLPDRMSDKVAHMLLYCGLGFLLARAIAGGLDRPVPLWTPPLVMLLALLYGLSDEFHQLFVPRRQFDVLDLVADAVGAGVGAGAVWLWSIISRFRDALR